MITYNTLPANTRVWIYQSDQPFTSKDLPEIKKAVYAFSKNWVSHNRALKSFGDVYHNRFIVLMVDESNAGASGCSIDKSVYFIQSLEQKYGVDMFDRMNFTYRSKEGIKAAHREEFTELYKLGLINDETIVFNNLVSTKAEFEQKWETPLRKSWHKRLIMN